MVLVNGRNVVPVFEPKSQNALKATVVVDGEGVCGIIVLFAAGNIPLYTNFFSGYLHIQAQINSFGL